MKRITIFLLIAFSVIFAQKTYVPDDKFEQALIDLGYDTTLDDSVLTANISSVTTLDVNNKEISDLTGIEAFTSLTALQCYLNKLTSLDVSNNTALTSLNLYGNSLTSLDISKNTTLTLLNFSENKITSIDLTNNTALNELNCWKNQLTNLDVSKNINLKVLNFYSNQLTSLDVSANTALTYLHSSENKLTSLDVSTNTALEYLHCADNQLTSLDVSKNTALTYIHTGGNPLTSLDVSSNTALTELHTNSMALNSLDVSKNTALKMLFTSANNLTSLDVSSNTALEYLHAVGNQLTAIDVSTNDVLRSLEVENNKLTTLDVSRNTALTKLRCQNNQLTSLNIRNGVKEQLSVKTKGNPNLTCIEVLDPAWATANWTSANEIIDAGVTFAYICGVDVDGVSTYNNNGIKAITFNVELPTHSIPDTNISLAFWKSGAESNECTGCNGRDTVWMHKLSDDHWEATVGLDTTLVAGDVGESMYWYHYVKTVSTKPEHRIDENGDKFKSTSNPDGLRQLAPGWHKKSSLAMVDTVTAWENISPERFVWIGEALDTLNISKTSLDDNYTLQWSASTNLDEDPIHYLVYAKVGSYPAEEIYDTTVTTLPISSREFLNNVFEQTPGNGVTVRFSVSATDGIDTVKVSGDDRVVYVNRYEFLSTETNGMPTEFALHENYPNPFNPSTTLRFDLPELSDVNVIIYNMLGQEVKTFNMQNISAGHHSIKWNATNDLGDPVSAGVYLYQLQTRDFVKTRKMILLK